MTTTAKPTITEEAEKKSRRRFTDDQKKDALRLVNQEGKTYAEVADSMEISVHQLKSWEEKQNAGAIFGVSDAPKRRGPKLGSKRRSATKRPSMAHAPPRESVELRTLREDNAALKRALCLIAR